MVMGEGLSNDSEERARVMLLYSQKQLCNLRPHTCVAVLAFGQTPQLHDTVGAKMRAIMKGLSIGNGGTLWTNISRRRRNPSPQTAFWHSSSCLAASTQSSTVLMLVQMTDAWATFEEWISER